MGAIGGYMDVLCSFLAAMVAIWGEVVVVT